MNHVLKIIPMFYYIVLSKPLDITNKNKERTLHFLMNYHIVLFFVILRLKNKTDDGSPQDFESIALELKL